MLLFVATLMRAWLLASFWITLFTPAAVWGQVVLSEF